MKYVEGNIPPEVHVHVTHYHHGNHGDLANGGAKYVTHAWLENTHGVRVGSAVAVCHGNNVSRCQRPVRRQMAVGRAFKQWYLREASMDEVGRQMELDLLMIRRERTREMQGV